MVYQAKFRVGNPETFLRLQMVDGLANFRLSPPQIHDVCDTYMDTRGRRLLAAGYSFRKREQPDGLMMTLATLSKPAGGVHRWEKYEILLASDRRPANWPESPIRTRMLQLTGKEHLVPLVRLQQTRIIRSLYRNEQQIAVVRLDSVGQLNGAKPQVRFEMEVELTSLAGEETLIDIVEYLENEWDLWSERETKFERAYTAEAKIPGDRYNARVIQSPGRLRRAS
jgi:inorganic triphosphatase YgiF